ncbi:diheme cytochrome c [Roseateles sp.]|uniref:diheme cytochrome c n=1 Tax=Roseateles sp. TaxID=1971397 RepID=UPI002E0C10DE|nr:diheme cytochrome c [Roseateles sp.]
MNFHTFLARAALALSALPLSPAVHADDHEGRTAVAWPKAYVQECAACHVAYPPRMLPAASWARLMGGLDRHFGTDASLDPQDVQRLGQWLQDNAGRDARATVPEDRITRTARFEHKHRHIEAATWRLPSVRSAANCMACHSGADQGRYSEHGLRMPEGLSARQRAAWDD